LKSSSEGAYPDWNRTSERLADFVADFKNRAWHIEKVKREYGINENFRFSPLFTRRRLPRAGRVRKQLRSTNDV
jgi:hypothetical protein